MLLKKSVMAMKNSYSKILVWTWKRGTEKLNSFYQNRNWENKKQGLKWASNWPPKMCNWILRV